jgi:histidyl-tRNA synthetase
VFEIVSEGLGAQNAICGGGAYEGLVEELGGQPTYGVGFAIGEDRLIDVLPGPARQRLSCPGPVLLRVIAEKRESAPEGAAAIAGAASELAEELRSAGIPVFDLGDETPARTYAHAEALASPAILVFGEDERQGDTVMVRTTADRAQRAIPRPDLVPYLKSFFL